MIGNDTASAGCRSSNSTPRYVKQNINFVNGGETVSKVWGSGPVIGVLRN
eukprot:COSAG01_NODE_76331_length_187_cov_5.204545_1_plen_49_part_10